MHSNHDLYLRLHRALREFPRYNQFGIALYGLKLAPVAVHVLLELSATPVISFQQMVERIAIEKSAVSKVLSHLVESSLVENRVDRDDKRVRNFDLTNRGASAVRQFDAQAEQRMLRFEERAAITESERKRIRRLLEELCDALGAPPSPHRSSEHILRPALRRLARSFGLLGRRALGSKLSALEWQLLLSICDNPGYLTPLEASALMRAPKSAIAIALRELLKRGYVKKKAHPVDKRSSFLLPRPAGTDLLRELESRAVDSYAALGMIRAEDVVLFERFVRGAAIEYYIGGRGLSVRELSSVEIEVARKKTLISYVERADIPIPPSCFLPSNRCVGLYLGVELVGAVELSDGLVPQVENLLCDPKAPPEILRAFLIEAGSDGLKSPVDVTRSIASSFLVPSSDNRTTLGLLIR